MFSPMFSLLLNYCHIGSHVLLVCPCVICTLLLSNCQASAMGQTKDNFYETGNGLPTPAEILLSALLVASSSGASSDRTVAERWCQDVMMLSGTGELDLASWRPSAEYTKGRGMTHQLMVMGKDWLVEHKPETTKALVIVMTQQGHMLIRNSMMWYLCRLREPQVSTTALSCNGTRR